MSDEIVKPAGFVWTFPARIDSFIDGDTPICHVLVHPNEGGELHDVHVRVEGINAPEMNTTEGKASKATAEQLAAQYGYDVILVAHKRDKYGRMLARIIFADGTDFSGLMIAKGAAVPYLT